MCSSYIVSLPALKASHRLTDGRVGLVGLVFALAALTSMQFVGRLITRIGSSSVLRISLVAMPFLLVVVGVVPDVTSLLIALGVLVPLLAVVTMTTRLARA